MAKKIETATKDLNIETSEMIKCRFNYRRKLRTGYADAGSIIELSSEEFEIHKNFVERI